MIVSKKTLATASSLFATTLIIGSITMFTACGDDTPDNPDNPTPTESKVIVHQLDDPDMLNPVNNQGASSTAIMANIFQKLLNVDHKTLQLVPVLAEAMPEVAEQEDGTVHITYTIREEAKWDDGSPVTGADVDFTMRALKNPKVTAQHKRGYLEFIKGIILDEANPKKVTYITDKYVRAIYSTGAEVYIIPKYVYDPQGLMDGFTIEQLNTQSDALSSDPNIIAFAEEFNSEKWQREPGYVVGSGAYSFDEWTTGQRIVLKKKADWWGKDITDNHYFQANPDVIVNQIVNDAAGSISSLKRGDLEVMQISKPKDFDDLKESNAFRENFNGVAVPSLIYSYLGFNTKKPHLNDKRTRQALAHLLDVEYIIREMQRGYGERTIGPVMPVKDYYNHDIVPYDFNPEKAKTLLDQAGIKDYDGDGMRDFDGEDGLQTFTILLTYNQGNEARKNVCLLFQEECAKAGIKIEVVAQEWSIYLENQKSHNFEMYYGAWVGEHAPQDPTQLWHQESANGGSNYPSFGNEYTDELIEKIKSELDDEIRKGYWMEFQQIIHDEVPYIFMAARKRLLAIHKKYDNAEASSMDPGYWEAGMILRGNGNAQ